MKIEGDWNLPLTPPEGKGTESIKLYSLLEGGELEGDEKSFKSQNP